MWRHSNNIPGGGKSGMRKVILVDCVWIVDILMNERRAGKGTKIGMHAEVGGGTVMDFKAGMVSITLSGSTADIGVRSTGPSSLSPARFS